MLKIDTATDLSDLFEDLRAFLKAGQLGTATLTLTGNASDADTVTLQHTAAGTFTLTAQPTHGETVTIGPKVYTFQDALAQSVDGAVLIGTDEVDSIANLVDAINRGPGEGVLWALENTYHPSVEAIDAGAGVMTVRAKVPGTAGNAIATTDACADGSWGAGTLAGGAAQVYTLDATLDDGTAYHVQIGADADETLDNLIACINAGAGAGTAYSTATPSAHADLLAAAGAGDTMTVTARRAQQGLDSLTLATDITGATWDVTTLTGNFSGWVELKYDAGTEIVLLRAPGLAGDQRIYIGFQTNESVGTDTYCLRFFMNKEYNPSLNFVDQTGFSAYRYHLAWDSATPYWFVANGQRLIVTTKVSTIYSSSYVGAFLPYGTPSEYPQPWVVLCNQSALTRFSSTHENTRNFWDPSPSSCRFLHPDGVWWTGGNHEDSSGSESRLTESAGFIWPFNDNNSTTRDRYRELRDNVDGSYTLFPLKITSDNPALDILGELDGAYAVPAFAAASEDTITQDGVVHLVVGNVFRTARYYYGAIALR